MGVGENELSLLLHQTLNATYNRGIDAFNPQT